MDVTDDTIQRDQTQPGIDKPKHILHILTDDDVEEMLLRLDDLYWTFLQLSKRRSIEVNFDPTALAKNWSGHKVQRPI